MTLEQRGVQTEHQAVTPLPEPLQRSRTLERSDPLVPRNARTLGPNATFTHARGYLPDSATGGPATFDVREPTGELTPTGRAATKKVGGEVRPPVDSVRAVVRVGDRMFVGHWIDGRWFSGLALNGRTVVANCNWTQLKEAYELACWETLGGGNAASGEDVRAPDGQMELPF